MDDQQASGCIDAILNLAVVLRDEGPDAVLQAAREALLAAGDDPVAAIAIAAALIRVDDLVETWWDRPPLARTHQLLPCGTHAAAERHRIKGEDLDAACQEANRRYYRDRDRRDREAATRAPRELAPCGTHAAYERHQRRGEPIDDHCRTANSQYKMARAAARRQSAA